MKSKAFDLLGISAALLCLIHCLLLPVLMIVPLGLEHNHNAYIDLGFLLIGAAVVYQVTRTVKSKWLKGIFWAAIGLIGLSVLLDIAFHFHSPLIYPGAVLLIAGHVINFKNHKHNSGRNCDFD